MTEKTLNRAQEKALKKKRNILIVLVAFFGTFVATWLGGAPALINAIVVGSLVFAATVANLLMIPHPLWFSVAALVGIPVSAFFGGKLAPRRVAE